MYEESISKGRFSIINSKEASETLLKDLLLIRKCPLILVVMYDVVYVFL